MAIERWSDAIWLASLGDEPGFSDDLQTLMQQLQRSDDQNPDVVISLNAVGRINSSNLSQLLRLRKLMIDRQGRLRLAAIPDGIWAVFITTGLDKVFHFSEDVPSALASLQM